MPGIFVADGAASSSADRGHSLRSLHPPPAALPSLPIAGPVIVYGVSASVILLDNDIILNVGIPVPGNVTKLVAACKKVYQ